MAIKALHFVYNVDATPQGLVRDFVHRLVDPATYPCRLCDITYGRFVKKPGWRRFLRSLPVRSVFHTRGGFTRKFPQSTHREFPVVLAESLSGDFRVFISSQELATLPSLEALQSEVGARLEQHRCADVQPPRSAEVPTTAAAARHQGRGGLGNPRRGR
jgi:hypothetical protein